MSRKHYLHQERRPPQQKQQIEETQQQLPVMASNFQASAVQAPISHFAAWARLDQPLTLPLCNFSGTSSGPPQHQGFALKAGSALHSAQHLDLGLLCGASATTKNRGPPNPRIRRPCL
mmetsp:Transcript_51699/g.109823  ORF Transcript_51699/g.109823 Transcript_51699/m.109823 type:complete len:118 (-) Transcript_51699:206-559(-)